MMTCERCSGLMVRDSLYYVADQFLELEVGRCVNCGHTIDLTQLKFRLGLNNQGTPIKEKVLV